MFIEINLWLNKTNGRQRVRRINTILDVQKGTHQFVAMNLRFCKVRRWINGPMQITENLNFGNA